MEMFGKVDKNKEGGNSSEYPAWYFERHVDELKESISTKKRHLERGVIEASEVPRERQEVANLESKLEAILKSQPNPSIPEKDKLNKAYKSLGAKISDSMFTRSEMHMGTADAHTEADRMTKPCIGLSPEEAGLAKTCGIKLSQDRKVSRNEAAKVFKLVGKILNEPTNIEVLRRDSVTEQHTTVH